MSGSGSIVSGSAAPAGMSSQQYQQLVQQNAAARALILQQAVPATQLVYTNTIAAPGQNNNVINVQPRPVGLIRGFWVHFKGTLNNGTGNQLVRQPWGGANALSNIIFNDINNYQRINTSGIHLFGVNTRKTGRPFATVFADTAPIGFGDNLTILQCPTTIAPNGSATIEWWYWLPLSFGLSDLRGAIFGNLVNATMLMQLTINPLPAVPSTGDATLSLYTGTAAAATFSNVTVEVWQHWLDQLPGGGAILPTLDLSWIYELKQTSVVGLVAGQDFPVNFANFRNFLSMLVLFDNGGQANAGTDINYLALQTANFTNIFKVSPALQKLWERQRIETEYPVGSYMVDFSTQPISSVQYGNVNLIINPSLVNAGAQIIVGFEDLGQANTILPAGSLPAG